MKIVAMNSGSARLFDVLLQGLCCTFTVSSLYFNNNNLQHMQILFYFPGDYSPAC